MTETNARTRELAKRFHDTYERLAPPFGYATRSDTKTFDPESPNGKLMVAVCSEILLSEREEARREAIEECAEICLSTWKEAPNEKPHYKQNQISHGCIASNEAILALLKKK